MTKTTFLFLFVYLFIAHVWVSFTGAPTELYAAGFCPGSHIYMMSCLAEDSKQGALQVSQMIFSQSDQRHWRTQRARGETDFSIFFLHFFFEL